MEWVEEEGIDIIGINETNISEKKEKYMIKKESNYVGLWTSANEEKLKGSGVGLVVKKK